MILSKSSLLACALLGLATPSLGQWSLESLSERKASSGITTVGRYLMIAGGGSFAGVLDSVDVYDAQTRSWSVDQLSVPRSGLAAAAWDGLAYFSGGILDDSSVTDVIEVFDSSTGAWSQLALPSPRWGHAAAATNGVIMFASGYDGSAFLNSVDLYHVPSATWSTATIADARMNGIVLAVGDELMIAGGSSGNGTWPDSVAFYNTVTQTWRTDTVPGSPRIGAGASIGNRAFFVSHAVANGANVHIYDSATQTWSGKLLSQTRGEAGVVALGTRVLFGGGDVFPNSQTTVDVYDTVLDTWSVEQLPYSTHRTMTGSVYGRAVFAGGLHNALISDQVNVYEPDVGSSFCGPAVPNSTGVGASIRAVGSMRAGGEPLALVAENMPAGQFSLFLAGRFLSQSPIMGSNGILCLGAPLGRFANDLTVTSAAGVTSILVDTEALPLLGGTAAMLGETWYFQAWFREPAGSSNLSNAVGVTFN